MKATSRARLFGSSCPKLQRGSGGSGSVSATFGALAEVAGSSVAGAQVGADGGAAHSAVACTSRSSLATSPAVKERCSIKVDATFSRYRRRTASRSSATCDAVCKVASADEV